MKVAIINRFIMAAALGVAAASNLAFAATADVGATAPAAAIPDSTVDIWNMIDANLTDIHAVLDPIGFRQKMLITAKDQSGYLKVKQATSNIKDLVLALPARIDGKDANRPMVERDADDAATKAKKFLQAIDDPVNDALLKSMTKLEEAVTTLRAFYPNGIYAPPTR